MNKEGKEAWGSLYRFKVTCNEARYGYIMLYTCLAALSFIERNFDKSCHQLR